MNCHHCKTPLNLEAGVKLSINEECPKCSSDIHCCVMCSNYDLLSSNQCKEPNIDKILDKKKKNFCDYFKLKSDDEKSSAPSKDQLMANAMALFKK